MIRGIKHCFKVARDSIVKMLAVAYLVRVYRTNIPSVIFVFAFMYTYLFHCSFKYSFFSGTILINDVSPRN